jgi:L-2-hydroxyglutarate oxidase
MQRFDVAVIGAGAVGLATAYELHGQNPRLEVCVLDKEFAVGSHQSGRNSGVLHTGIYYRAGSAKAENCRTGKRLLEDFCEREGVPSKRTGKVILATEERELPALHALFDRGQKDGVDCALIGPDRLEPAARAVEAIWVPEAGVVDFVLVCNKLASLLESSGVALALGAELVGIRRGNELVLETTRGELTARCVVNCGGLQCDRVAELGGASAGLRIVPFRGEYYSLSKPSSDEVRALIYPVPDARFPFLGVHFTRGIDGVVECGPNAVLALGRESYEPSTFNLRDLADALAYPGFRRLARRHLRAGLSEMWRSISKAAFCRALQRLVPSLREEDLSPAPAGIRAQAVLPDGSLADDFVIRTFDRIVHVCNAPSPAATSCLSIGRRIAHHVSTELFPS